MFGDSTREPNDDAFGEEPTIPYTESDLAAEFANLTYDPPCANVVDWELRRWRVLRLMGACTSAYEFYQLAGFLRGDEDETSQGILVALLRLAWLLRREIPQGDAWEDTWWCDSLIDVRSDSRRKELEAWAQAH